MINQSTYNLSFQRNRCNNLLAKIIKIKKILGLVLAWKSGLKVILLPSGPSHPLQTILLSDLVGCRGQTEVAVRCTCLKFDLKRAKQPLLPPAGCHTRPRNPNLKTMPKLPLVSAEGCHTRLDGQHCPLRKYLSIFSRKNPLRI